MRTIQSNEREKRIVIDDLLSTTTKSQGLISTKFQNLQVFTFAFALTHKPNICVCAYIERINADEQPQIGNHKFQLVESGK